jgi:PBP1b-binding outer membrane lipoprotein LpoB
MTITKKSIYSLLAILMLGLSGCSTMQDVVKAKESGAEGTTKTYSVPESQAWDIAKAVFRWEGADAIEEHRDQHYMLTSSGMNLITMGTVMGAWTKPLNTENTEVTVVTKRRVTTNLATTLTEGTFHKRFAQGVNIVKSGKPLPETSP